jgi:hypothetical protein
LFNYVGIDMFTATAKEKPPKGKGAIADSRIALEYAPFKHVGFGLAWDDFRLKAEAEDEDTGVPGSNVKGTFDFKNQGFMLYLKCFF